MITKTLVSTLIGLFIGALFFNSINRIVNV